MDNGMQHVSASKMPNLYWLLSLKAFPYALEQYKSTHLKFKSGKPIFCYQAYKSFSAHLSLLRNQ